MTAGGDGALLVPISRNQFLQGSLEVTEGDADIEVTETSHGLALRIAYSGGVSIRGWVETTGSLGRGNLTMLEDAWWGVKQSYWVGLGGGGSSGTPEMEPGAPHPHRRRLVLGRWRSGGGLADPPRELPPRELPPRGPQLLMAYRRGAPSDGHDGRPILASALLAPS